MSYKGGNRVPFQRTVTNSGDGQMKCLVVLSMIHNLKLYKASLITTAIEKRQSPSDSRAKKLSCLKNFCC